MAEGVENLKTMMASGNCFEFDVSAGVLFIIATDATVSGHEGQHDRTLRGHVSRQWRPREEVLHCLESIQDHEIRGVALQA